MARIRDIQEMVRVTTGEDGDACSLVPALEGLDMGY